jgi:hypothetical protein
MGIVSKASRLSRRVFVQFLAAPLALAFTASELDRPDRLAPDVDQAPKLDLERHYRADVQVLVLGLPLVRREGVGGGRVLWREFEGRSTARLLEFSGFSSPARAAGLNRLGFIRETARSSSRGGLECKYFGLMTASGEETPEQARRALHSTAREQTYTAIDGRIAAGATETSVVHFTAPSDICGERSPELIELAFRALTSADKSAAGTAPDNARSFLQTLAELLMRSDGVEEGYIYSGRSYRLRLARVPDEKATRYFREHRLIAGPTEVLRVSGKIRREAGGKETEFCVWIASGSERPLPLRIEYQAKPYLKLVFEAIAD